MQVIAGHIDGPLVVRTALEVRGTVTGQVTVLPDAHLVLRGVCKGNVIISDGARAELWGIVEGDVGNQGGNVSIFGIVEGQLVRGEGETHLSSDSIVRGRGGR
jgi:cytoskeletal protein CcmA (bactofilin family)